MSRRRKRTPPTDYPAGHFLVPVFAWFGPGWRSAMPDERKLSDAERRVHHSHGGWAGNTLDISERTPKNAAPTWMARARAR